MRRLPDFTKETRGEIVEFLERVEQWQMPATSLHDDVLLDSSEYHV